MYYSSYLMFMVVLTGSSCAVFYTKDPQVDYPRIGRRSFYTTSEGNHYPRIGRRDVGAMSSLIPGSEFMDYSELSKGNHGTMNKRGFLPNIGRRASLSNQNDLHYVLGGTKKKEFLSNFDTNSKSDTLRDQKSTADDFDLDRLNVPLDFLFIAFDLDGDGKLSKSEFMTGMQVYKQQPRQS